LPEFISSGEGGQFPPPSSSHTPMILGLLIRMLGLVLLMLELIISWSVT